MKYPFDTANKCDGLDLLRSVPDAYSPLVFCDPEYDHLMVKLKYGNKGVERQQKRFQLPQQSDDQISQFIKEAARVLRPSGYLALWIDKNRDFTRFDARVRDVAWRIWLPADERTRGRHISQYQPPGAKPSADEVRDVLRKLAQQDKDLVARMVREVGGASKFCDVPSTFYAALYAACVVKLKESPAFGARG